jgi:hypothetical protein
VLFDVFCKEKLAAILVAGSVIKEKVIHFMAHDQEFSVFERDALTFQNKKRH